MIPCLVADRPISLKIIRGFNAMKPNIKIGLMSHANTSINFQNIFSKYPCAPDDYCEIVGMNCPHNKCIDLCDIGFNIKNEVVKICDSGIFQKKGCNMTYYELFETYDLMKTDYGIIIDEVRNKKNTLQSAEKALLCYNENSYKFKLVGVAQGNNIDEYVDCYEELKSMGYSYIAIGGLLRKRNNTARYTFVKNTNLMIDVLKEIRNIDKDGWIYALGCYHPKRHSILLKYNVFGSDYKGWIFQYDIAKGVKSNIPVSDIEGRRKSRFQQVRQYLLSIFDLPQTLKLK